MTISRDPKSIQNVKQKVKNVHECPACGEKNEIGIELDILNEFNEEHRFPYAHLNLHGDPLHAVIFYMNRHLTVRGTQVVKSVELSRDSSTFNQIPKRLLNPV